MIDGMRHYSGTLRKRMLAKMLAPGGKSVSELAEEAGIPPGTLYNWKARASEADRMGTKRRDRRPSDWSTDEKIEAVAEALALTEEELGAFLRQKGLHEADLARWRSQIEESLGSGSVKKKGKPESRRIRDLERELQRKEKALAEAAALLVLKKKAQSLWGDEDDDTGSGRER